MPNKARTFRLSLRSNELEAFARAACAAGWVLRDTGERVSTEEGLDAESVVLVETPPLSVRFRSDAFLAGVPR